MIRMLAVAAALLVSAAALAQPEVGAELVVEGLSSPVHLVAPEGSDRRFIVDQTGVVLELLPDDTLADQPFLDISDRIVELREGFEERGLLGFAFHPEFATNGRFYVHYSGHLRDDAPGNWDHTAVVSEFTVPTDTPERADPATERILLEVDQVNRKTNAGALAFGPDGYLYIAMGEGGGAHGIGEVAFGALEVPARNNVWDFQAQDIHTLYGKILRIDVDRGWPGYVAPESNPLVGKPGRDEVYAWGFRNHYRMSFDPAGDRDLMVAAVSESLWETVYRVDAPGNYGWPIREGTTCYDRQSPLDPPEECPREGPQGWRIHDPVIQYPNLNIVDSPLEGEPLGTAIVGGEVYRGTEIPALFGAYVFADYSADPETPSGTVFMARPSQDIGALWPIQALVRLEARAQGMGRDAQGELYVLTRESFGPQGDTGKVFRLVAGDASGADGEGRDGDSAGGEAGAAGGDADASGGDAEAAGAAAGLWTQEQADRGREAYVERCSECHARNLRAEGPFPPLIGDAFFDEWGGRPIGELFRYVHDFMPLDAPGELSDQTYADVVAYMLSRYGYEATDAELPPDPERAPDVPLEDRRD